MKYAHPENIYGVLVSKDGVRSEPVFLGIAESNEEEDEIMEEYIEVFGYDMSDNFNGESIVFCFDYATKEQMADARRKAFTELLSILSGPINTVITGLKAIKR